MQGLYHSSDALAILLAMLRTLNLAERAGSPPELALAYANAHGVAGIIPMRRLAVAYARRADEALAAVSDGSVRTWVRLMTMVYRVGIGDGTRRSPRTERPSAWRASSAFAVAGRRCSRR